MNFNSKQPCQEKILFPDTLQLVEKLSALLLAKSMLFGAAESCTGGLLSFYCTELPGSSTWFSGAVISYANAIKNKVLHVPLKKIANYGAVSQEVVEHMAHGACQLLQVDLAAAVSGIAGPSGGSHEKPVGTVWMSVVHAPCYNRTVITRKVHFQGDRSFIRLQATQAVLLLCLEALTAS